MSDTFLVYQVSSRETIRYEIPMSFKPCVDTWYDGLKNLHISGLRGYPKTMSRWLAMCAPDLPPELYAQIRVTKKPTMLYPLER